jgi:hypothetical protein
MFKKLKQIGDLEFFSLIELFLGESSGTPFFNRLYFSCNVTGDLCKKSVKVRNFPVNDRKIFYCLFHLRG